MPRLTRPLPSQQSIAVEALVSTRSDRYRPPSRKADQMTTDVQTARAQLRTILIDTLGISRARADSFNDETPLFGAIPELDSMAVATLLTEIEDRLSVIIDDDDVTAETFETFGTLSRFVLRKTTT